MRKILVWSICFFSFLIPLSSFLSTRVLLLALIISLFPLGTYKRIIEVSWDILLYLLILVFGVIYSEDSATAMKVLETSFSLLALSLIFAKYEESDQKKVNLILYSFSLGLSLACLICVSHASIRYLRNFDSIVFFFYNLTEIISSHPTYMAYYLIFAITFGLYQLDYDSPPVHPLIGAVITLFFFLVLVLTGGQTAFVSLLLVFSFFILKFILGDRSCNQKLTFGLVVIMMASMFFVSSTQNSNRENNLNDSWDRFDLWKSAIDANPNVLFGVGTGDSKSVLNEYFREHNLDRYAKESLNSHNQFIHTYLSNGIVGLLALVFMLARTLYLAFKNNSALGILVFFPFLIYGMTEVFLGRYQGVVFFALLHQVFVSYYTSSKPAFSLKET